MLRSPTAKDSALLHNALFKAPENDRATKLHPHQRPLTVRRKSRHESCSRGGGGRVASAASGNMDAESREWIDSKSLERILDNHSADATRELYNRVLTDEASFVNDFDRVLESSEIANRRKKEILYKKWQERVFSPVRRQIKHTFKRGYQRFFRAKNQAHLDYLNAHHHKNGQVFLDVISPDDGEYRPMTLYGPGSEVAMTARLPALKDPLHSAQRKLRDEERMVLRCESTQRGPLQSDPSAHPNARNVSDEWPTMFLKDIICPKRDRRRNTWTSVSGGDGTISIVSDPERRESFDFAYKTDEPVGADVIDTELQIQKRRKPNLPPIAPKSNPIVTVSPANFNTRL